jgi:hypothetical protein
MVKQKRNSEDKQYNGQKKKNKRTNNDLQHSTQKTKDQHEHAKSGMIICAPER